MFRILGTESPEKQISIEGSKVTFLKSAMLAMRPIYGQHPVIGEIDGKEGYFMAWKDNPATLTMSWEARSFATSKADLPKALHGDYTVGDPISVEDGLVYPLITVKQPAKKRATKKTTPKIEPKAEPKTSQNDDSEASQEEAVAANSAANGQGASATGGAEGEQQSDAPQETEVI